MAKSGQTNIKKTDKSVLIMMSNVILAIPLIVTDDSGIVTGHSGDRDRRVELAEHSAL